MDKPPCKIKANFVFNHSAFISIAQQRSVILGGVSFWGSLVRTGRKEEERNIA